MNEEKKIVWLYIRVSTKDQSREGSSLPEQEKRLRAMCEYKGYEIYKVYKDAGISAKTGNKRLVFEELLQDIKDTKCNIIVVLKIDRFFSRRKLEIFDDKRGDYKNIGKGKVYAASHVGRYDIDLNSEE